MCDSSIGIVFSIGNCDSMPDEEAIKIFESKGWFFSRKIKCKLCPECKKKMDKIK
jgi:hypothetical protein